MPYVHLANGDVKQFDVKEFGKVFGDEPPRVFRDNGVEHHVIGVYPDEVEYDTSVDEATQRENDDRADYEEWKRNRDAETPYKESDTE